MSGESTDNVEQLEEQIRISKLFLEYSHGMALRHGNVEKARAYYDAIGLVDDALERNWDPDAGGLDDELARNAIERSRAARSEGVKAATLHEQRMEQQRKKYQPTLFDRILGWFYGR